MSSDRNDRVYKIMPIIDHLNACFGQFFQPFRQTYFLDEAMEQYYGHHSKKQFIREPIRYGFKLWRLTSPQGYLVKFQPYTGSDKTPGKPVGAKVTVSAKVTKYTSSPHFENIYIKLSVIHPYNARASQKGNFFLPRSNFKKTEKSVIISGTKIWNNISQIIRNKAGKPQIFKKELKKYLLNEQKKTNRLTSDQIDFFCDNMEYRFWMNNLIKMSSNNSIKYLFLHNIYENLYIHLLNRIPAFYSL